MIIKLGHKKIRCEKKCISSGPLLEGERGMVKDKHFVNKKKMAPSTKHNTIISLCFRSALGVIKYRQSSWLCVRKANNNISGISWKIFTFKSDQLVIHFRRKFHAKEKVVFQPQVVSTSKTTTSFLTSPLSYKLQLS